jgi:hypothetical protein
MSLPRPDFALLAFALLGPVVALGPGCGAPPAKDPSPPVASEERPKQDATGLSGSPRNTTTVDPIATMAASGSGAAAPPASSGSAAKGNERLEDKTFTKAGSAGGQYSVIVLSVAGLDTGEVGVALGNASPRSDTCYSTFFKKPLANPGSTVFDVSTSGKGKTQSVKLKSDDLKDADLVKCLDGVIKGVHWPSTKEKGGGKTTIEWRAKGN